MKINLSLKAPTGKSRRVLEEARDNAQRALKNFTAAKKTLQHFEDTRTKVESRIATLEKEADGTNAKLANELAARKDQLMRLKISIGASEQKIADFAPILVEVFGEASDAFRNAAAAPLAAELRGRVAKALAPFYLGGQSKAAEVDIQTDAHDGLRIMMNPSFFHGADAMARQIGAILQRIEALLAGEPLFDFCAAEAAQEV